MEKKENHSHLKNKQVNKRPHHHLIVYIFVIQRRRKQEVMIETWRKNIGKIA